MYTAILAPIDVQVPETSDKIINRAIFHVQKGSAKLHLLAIAPKGADENTLDEYRSQLMAFSETHFATNQEKVELHISTGLPSESALEYAEKIKADLILVGSHRGGGQLGRVSLGSTAAKVAAMAKCDVCIVRP